MKRGPFDPTASVRQQCRSEYFVFFFAITCAGVLLLICSVKSNRFSKYMFISCTIRCGTFCWSLDIKRWTWEPLFASHCSTRLWDSWVVWNVRCPSEAGTHHTITFGLSFPFVNQIIIILQNRLIANKITFLCLSFLFFCRTFQECDGRQNSSVSCIDIEWIVAVFGILVVFRTRRLLFGVRVNLRR